LAGVLAPVFAPGRRVRSRELEITQKLAKGGRNFRVPKKTGIMDKTNRGGPLNWGGRPVFQTVETIPCRDLGAFRFFRGVGLLPSHSWPPGR